jgi:hypothetical protein
MIDLNKLSAKFPLFPPVSFYGIETHGHFVPLRTNLEERVEIEIISITNVKKILI